MNEVTLTIENGELWWGGDVVSAPEQPYDSATEKKIDLYRCGGNQSAPLFVSTHGRYLHADSPMRVIFSKGTIVAVGENVVCVKAGETLKDAYLAAMKAHFPFEQKELPESFFRTAQYNTWMEFTYNPTQKSVLDYAHAIVENGYEPGILIIDEGWSVHYGVWEFDFAKFPDPKAMVDELHALGFTVMLWVVPYVTPDGREFLDHYDEYTVTTYAKKKFVPRLIRQKNGEIALLHWWNGFSAVLDVRTKQDAEYLDGKLQYLMQTYGVDGFKFDGGNIDSLAACNWLTEAPEASPEELNKAWNDFGARYTYHEYKDTYDRGGRATVQRIRDRGHSWGADGLQSLVPMAIVQGLLGYAYICPDMIGGGEWAFNLVPDFHADEELFARMAQCSALFPMMQFSWAPWTRVGKNAQKVCLEAAKLHKKFADKIVALVKQTPKTGEPILRSMEYAYPHQGYERIVDQFLLGDDILVCPVVEQGATTRKVALPKGKWRYCGGAEYVGGTEIEVDAPIEVLPYFEKIC